MCCTKYSCLASSHLTFSPLRGFGFSDSVVLALEVGKMFRDTRLCSTSRYGYTLSTPALPQFPTLSTGKGILSDDSPLRGRKNPTSHPFFTRSLKSTALLVHVDCVDQGLDHAEHVVAHHTHLAPVPHRKVRLLSITYAVHAHCPFVTPPAARLRPVF